MDSLSHCRRKRREKIRPFSCFPLSFFFFFPSSSSPSLDLLSQQNPLLFFHPLSPPPLSNRKPRPGLPRRLPPGRLRLRPAPPRLRPGDPQVVHARGAHPLPRRDDGRRGHPVPGRGDQGRRGQHPGVVRVEQGVPGRGHGLPLR